VQSEQSPLDVSVVIPCLNEANSIGYCVEKAIAAFQAAGCAAKWSCRTTGRRTARLSWRKNWARGWYTRNKRIWGGIAGGNSGVARAIYRHGDADDSYDFTEVPRFVEAWRKGFDVVMGNRFKGEIKAGRDAVAPQIYWESDFERRVEPVVFMQISAIRIAACGDLPAQCSTRWICAARGWNFASEFVIKATQLGAKITEIPITLWKDKRGRPPHLRSFRDGWRHLRFMLLYAPNWLFLLPGALLVAAGLFFSVLAAARAATDFRSSRARRSHDDLRCDFHAARRANTFDWRVCQSLQLFGTIRSRNGVAEASAETRDAGDGFAAGRRIGADGLRLCVDYVGLGVEWFWRITCVRGVLFWSMWLFWDADIFASFF